VLIAELGSSNFNPGGGNNVVERGLGFARLGWWLHHADMLTLS